MAATRGTTATITARRLRPAAVYEVIGGETSQRRLDDMALAVLVGVLVDETIGTGGSHSRSENAFALFAGPFAGLFARTKGFNSTGRQCSTGSLGNTLFAAITLTMAAIPATTARARR